MQEMLEVHRGTTEKRERSGSLSTANLVECQPNNAAPLLRDEKGRREWIEHELDLSCQVCILWDYDSVLLLNFGTTTV